MDTARRAAFDTARKRSAARQRAERQWQDLRNPGRASAERGRADEGTKGAGSRYAAERRADTRAESEARRKRWRRRSFDLVWRDHMPLDHDGSEAKRAEFLDALESVVERFAGAAGDAPSGAPSGASGGAPGGGASVGRASGTAASGGGEGGSRSWSLEMAELEELMGVNNVEVLRVELQDAAHRASKHRERSRWLEGETKLAESKAAMWRGATPSTASDRMQAMEREC